MIIRNFLFHRVTEEYDRLWPAITPDRFCKILATLQKKFLIVGLEDYLSGRTSTASVRPLVTLSFDDGFKDNQEVVSDILYKKGIPASFYVVTDCISKNIPTWTYRLDYLMTQTQRLDYVLEGLNSTEYKENLKFSSQVKLFEFVKWLKPHLKKQSLVVRENILYQIYDQIKDVELPKVMMNWDDVRSLHQEGFTVGSHSATHPMLGHIEDEKRLYAELRESALEIEKQIGIFPETISYPNGSYNPMVMELAKKAGYKYGLAVNQKFYNTETDKLFEIPRLEIYNESWLKTRLRLTGGLGILKRFIKE